MLKLFAVVLGGRADGCNIELHDIVFVIGETLQSTYPKLVSKWFGNQKRLHIDSTIELKYIDGYEVRITQTKPTSSKKLYFVNFGAYKPNYFGEFHETKFYVGTHKSEILSRAKTELCHSLIEPHCDDNIAVDDLLMINQIDNYYIDLHPTIKHKPLEIKSVYKRLDRIALKANTCDET